MTIGDWRALRRRARREYVKLRRTDDSHPGFAASTAIERVCKGIGYGVEGFCDEVGDRGVTYLNRGDSYAVTICFTSWNERFHVCAWAQFVEGF